ncbi:hypothetical protein FRB99_008836 [Tulasnella sp. 403]|nr:hypothetical protein FRB99_008836 [Tulasnella sp. 403]
MAWPYSTQADNIFGSLRSANHPSPSFPFQSQPSDQTLALGVNMQLENMIPVLGKKNDVCWWIRYMDSRVACSSEETGRQLAWLAPLRFSGFFSAMFRYLPPEKQRKATSSWGNLRECIIKDILGDQWLSNQRLVYTLQEFRELGYSQETPFDFIVRRLDLYALLNRMPYDEETAIASVMLKIPREWDEYLHWQPGSIPTFCELLQRVDECEEMILKNCVNNAVPLMSPPRSSLRSRSSKDQV